MDYSALLSELKPVLPKGYQSKILKSIEGVKEWHIKHAFSKRSVRTDILRKIYSKAKLLAVDPKEKRRQFERERREVKKIVKRRRRKA